MLFMTTVCLLVSLFLGGGTKVGFLGDFAAQLAAVPLLMTAVLKGDHTRRVVLAGAAVIVGLLAFQFAPLGAAGLSSTYVSTAEHGLAAAGLPSNWSIVTLTPHASIAAAMSLLPPLAIFAAMSSLDGRERLTLLRIMLLFSGASVLVGLLQLAQGPTSPLYLFEFTNRSDAVGFFANRNHYSALLYMTLPLAGAVLIGALPAVSWKKLGRSRDTLVPILSVLLVLALLAGLVMARSRAGIALGGAAIVAMAILALRTNGPVARRGRFSTGRIVVAALAATLIFALSYGIDRMLTRFDRDPLEDYRSTLTERTVVTANEAMPFGTGLGSFVPVYAAAELPDEVITAYANRAHNDAAEILLELGAIGVALVLGVLIWLARKSAPLLMPANSTWPSGPDRLIAQAALIAIALVLLHSLVDYPLRTTAISAFFALCCGLIVPPLRSVAAAVPVNEPRPAKPRSKSRGEMSSRRRHEAPAPRPHEITDWPASPPPERKSRTDDRWTGGDDDDWPDAWKR